jgi:hypothetical protein
VAAGRLIAETQNPEGRSVRLESRTWNHVVERHPAMANCLDETMNAIALPSYREPDPRVGRERYFGPGGPQGWIRVVTELVGDVDRVVTAFPQRDPPTQGRGR